MRRDDDDGESIVDEGDGAVFHFAGGISFGVNIGEFFEFQGAFAGDGVEGVASEVEEGVSAQEFLGGIWDIAHARERVFHELWEGPQGV